jgi:hypothetical protein
VKTVTNILVFYKAGSFLIILVTASLQRTVLLHGISQLSIRSYKICMNDKVFHYIIFQITYILLKFSPELLNFLTSVIYVCLSLYETTFLFHTRHLYFSMALPVLSGSWSLIHFRNHFFFHRR